MQNLFQNEKLQKNNKELSKKMEEISSLVYKISAIAAFALLITGLCYFITYKKKSERIRKQEREISQAKDKLQQQAIENLLMRILLIWKKILMLLLINLQ